jgi:transcription-repair coupling factor (superfamily II helicase)
LILQRHRVCLLIRAVTRPLAAINNYLLIGKKQRVLLCAESAGRRESLLALLQKANLTPTLVNNWAEFLNSNASFALTIAPLEHGLCLPNLSVIAESQLFGQRVMQRRRRKATSGEGAAELAIRSLSELILAYLWYILIMVLAVIKA